ncbi:hypothetical protein ADUPG1_010607 [Aduncisulcus paluster]|uniref:SKI-interacting protein SKIP SNW domain-containing protein n=1 Tax=Aduncisulcus paluster TaxID=2918883 RepID=A0ABQ5JW77_9EUKA|nr:hypothetical protein ADUPG1_010607 [Aduncisulcus paluster]
MDKEIIKETLTIEDTKCALEQILKDKIDVIPKKQHARNISKYHLENEIERIRSKWKSDSNSSKTYIKLRNGKEIVAIIKEKVSDPLLPPKLKTKRPGRGQLTDQVAILHAKSDMYDKISSRLISSQYSMKKSLSNWKDNRGQIIDVGERERYDHDAGKMVSMKRKQDSMLEMATALQDEEKKSEQRKAMLESQQKEYKERLKSELIRKSFMDSPKSKDKKTNSGNLQMISPRSQHQHQSSSSLHSDYHTSSFSSSSTWGIPLSDAQLESRRVLSRDSEGAVRGIGGSNKREVMGSIEFVKGKRDDAGRGKRGPGTFDSISSQNSYSKKRQAHGRK